MEVAGADAVGEGGSAGRRAGGVTRRPAGRGGARAPGQRRPAGGGATGPAGRVATVGAELLVDGELANEMLDAADGVLSGCALGIAETGTVVLDGGARQG